MKRQNQSELSERERAENESRQLQAKNNEVQLLYTSIRFQEGLIPEPPFPYPTASVKTTLKVQAMEESFKEMEQYCENLEGKYKLLFTNLYRSGKASPTTSLPAENKILGKIWDILFTIWCQWYNALWARKNLDSSASTVGFLHQTMRACEKQLVELTMKAVEIDYLVNWTGIGDATWKSHFYLKCCNLATAYPGGGIRCAVHLMGLARGVFVERAWLLHEKDEDLTRLTLTNFTFPFSRDLSESIRTWYTEKIRNDFLSGSEAGVYHYGKSVQRIYPLFVRRLNRASDQRPQSLIGGSRFSEKRLNRRSSNR